MSDSKNTTRKRKSRSSSSNNNERRKHRRETLRATGRRSSSIEASLSASDHIYKGDKSIIGNGRVITGISKLDDKHGIRIGKNASVICTVPEEAKKAFGFKNDEISLLYYNNTIEVFSRDENNNEQHLYASIRYNSKFSLYIEALHAFETKGFIQPLICEILDALEELGKCDEHADVTLIADPNWYPKRSQDSDPFHLYKTYIKWGFKIYEEDKDKIDIFKILWKAYKRKKPFIKHNSRYKMISSLAVIRDKCKNNPNISFLKKPLRKFISDAFS
jgi:hypothetical protein